MFLRQQIKSLTLVLRKSRKVAAEERKCRTEPLSYLLKGPNRHPDNPGSGIRARIPSTQILDELMYQNVVFGFLLLTVGIITGSVWANSAWGSYWSWDPKETWSLITWLVYALLLHSRLVRGWNGRRIAWVSIIGFGCVIFTYLGVNFLLSGLHSYAR